MLHSSMMISHLRTGPTALFKVTTIKVASKLSKHGACIHSCTFERLGEGGFGGRGLLGTGRGHLTLLPMFLILVDSIDTSARRSTGEHAHTHRLCWWLEMILSRIFGNNINHQTAPFCYVHLLFHLVCTTNQRHTHVTVFIFNNQTHVPMSVHPFVTQAIPPHTSRKSCLIISTRASATEWVAFWDLCSPMYVCA